MNTKMNQVGDFSLYLSARPYDTASVARAVDRESQQTVSETIEQIAREYGANQDKKRPYSRRSIITPSLSLSPADRDALYVGESVPHPELSKIPYPSKDTIVPKVSLSLADMAALRCEETIPVPGLPTVLQTTSLRNRSGTGVLTHTFEGKIDVSSGAEYQHAVDRIMEGIPQGFWKFRAEDYDPYVLKLRMCGQIPGSGRGTFRVHKDYPNITIDSEGLLVYRQQGAPSQPGIHKALVDAYADVTKFVKEEVHRLPLPKLPALQRVKTHTGHYRNTLV